MLGSIVFSVEKYFLKSFFLRRRNERNGWLPVWDTAVTLSLHRYTLEGAKSDFLFLILFFPRKTLWEIALGKVGRPFSKTIVPVNTDLLLCLIH